MATKTLLWAGWEWGVGGGWGGRKQELGFPRPPEAHPPGGSPGWTAGQSASLFSSPEAPNAQANEPFCVILTLKALQGGKFHKMHIISFKPFFLRGPYSSVFAVLSSCSRRGMSPRGEAMTRALSPPGSTSWDLRGREPDSCRHHRKAFDSALKNPSHSQPDQKINFNFTRTNAALNS